MIFHSQPNFFLKNLLLPGDYLVFLLSFSGVLFLSFFFWDNATPENALIYQNGNLFARLSLNQKKEIEVPGPLGMSTIEIDFGKARVKNDPSPRQYCVKQSWLQKSGDIAICAPNQLSLKIVGRSKVYDSLNY